MSNHLNWAQVFRVQQQTPEKKGTREKEISDKKSTMELIQILRTDIEVSYSQQKKTGDFLSGIKEIYFSLTL